MTTIKRLFVLCATAALVLSFASCELEDDYESRRKPKEKATESDTVQLEELTADIEDITEIGISTEIVIEFDTETEKPDFGTEYVDPQPAERDFELTYRSERTKFLRGESFELTATVKNTTGNDHTWTGSVGEFRAEAILFIELDGGETYYLDHIAYPMTEEYRRYTVSNGISREVTYTFEIPEDAPEGYYKVLLSYGEEKLIAGGRFAIFEEPRVDINNLSQITVSCGGETISTATGLVGESYYNDNTGEAYEADGAGAYQYFWEIEAWGGRDGFLPSLTINEGDSIIINAPKSDGTPGMYYVKAGDDFNESESFVYPSDGTASIPAGEYYAVISSHVVYRSGDGKEYLASSYEDIFKLIVIEK